MHRVGLGITLPDSAGSIVLEDTAGNVNDRLNYGEYFALQAENAYVSTVNLDSLEKRAPLNAVYRTAGLSRPVGGSTPQVLVISTTGTLSGVPSIGVLPEGYTGAESGSYALERGGKAYEFTNHLGNVLAILSDKKLGQDTDADTLADYYHPETRMLTDYYPFGSPMVGRTWQSGSYRYGFNGMQKENEVVGEANAYDFGARLYDARVGRWWSVDPMESQFPWQSPYVVMDNDPINRIDPNGETGVGVKSLLGRKIVIKSVINFYGSAINNNVAQTIASNIQESWNSANGKVTIDGKKYKVMFKVRGRAISQQDALRKSSRNKSAKQNFIAVGKGHGVPHTDGRHGWWNTDYELESTTTPAHEFGHGINPYSGHPEIEEGGHVMIDDNPHIMVPKDFIFEGEPIDPSNRKVTQYNIDNLGLSDLFKGRKRKSVVGVMRDFDVIYNEDGSGAYFDGESYEDIEKKMFELIDKKNKEN